MFNGFEKMVLGSLGLEEPWYLKGMEFREEEPAIHVHIGIREGAEIACPECGGQARRYGYESKERILTRFRAFFHCPHFDCP